MDALGSSTRSVDVDDISAAPFTVADARRLHGASTMMPNLHPLRFRSHRPGKVAKERRKRPSSRGVGANVEGGTPVIAPASAGLRLCQPVLLHELMRPTGLASSPRGKNSAMTGLMSNTGVLSMASSSATNNRVPSTRTRRQMVLPSLWGRFLPRCAKIPTWDHAWL